MRFIQKVLRNFKATFIDSPDISINALVSAFSVERSTLLHCGAGLVEEAATYDLLQFKKVYWVEANPAIFQIAEVYLRSFKNQTIVQAALWDIETDIEMNVASNLGSSSLLKSNLHHVVFPDITFSGRVNLKTQTLDSLQLNIDPGSFLVMDLQGAELKALSGAENTLQKCDYAYIEASAIELYHNSPSIQDIVEYLSKDFKLVDWRISKKYGYGNLFFVRNHLARRRRIRRLVRFLISLKNSLHDAVKFTAVSTAID